MDGSLVIMEGCLLSRFLLLKWIVALSLWKVAWCQYLCHSNRSSLVIMEGSFMSRFLLLQWMVALTFLRVVYFRDFCYSNRW